MLITQSNLAKIHSMTFSLALSHEPPIPASLSGPSSNSHFTASAAIPLVPWDACCCRSAHWTARSTSHASQPLPGCQIGIRCFIRQ